MYVKNDNRHKIRHFSMVSHEPVGPNATLIGPTITGLTLRHTIVVWSCQIHTPYAM